MRRMKVRWILLGLILLPFLPQLPSCAMANASKYGRIVDVTSGKGIPDVAVIHATILYTGSSFAGGNTLTRVITHTDKNGNYWIPSAWLRMPHDIPFRFPGGNTHTAFLITALKPGYAFVGDDDAWNLYDQYGQPRFLPKSTAIQPYATWMGLFAKVDSLEMKPVDLTLKQAAIYYLRILGTGTLEVYEMLHNPDEVALTKQMNEYFKPLVCRLPPETEMDFNEAGALASFGPADFGVSHLHKLEPSGFKDAYMHPILHAKNVCEAMKFAGEKNEMPH